MKNLNRNYPDCSLNKKLREVYAIKQAINNSKMPADMKAKAMNECDKTINQYWRWCYEGKPGYTIDSKNPTNRIKNILTNQYGLEVNVVGVDILAQGDVLNIIVIPPSKLIEEWTVRVAPMAIFDSWYRCCAIDKAFGDINAVANWLIESEDYIYRTVLEYLTARLCEKEGK